MRSAVVPALRSLKLLSWLVANSHSSVPNTDGVELARHQAYHIKTLSMKIGTIWPDRITTCVYYRWVIRGVRIVAWEGQAQWQPILECTQNLQAITWKPNFTCTLSFWADWALTLPFKILQQFLRNTPLDLYYKDFGRSWPRFPRSVISKQAAKKLKTELTKPLLTKPFNGLESFVKFSTH